MHAATSRCRFSNQTLFSLRVSSCANRIFALTATVTLIVGVIVVVVAIVIPDDWPVENTVERR